MKTCYVYKIILTSKNVMETERIINALAEEGWRVISATDHQIFMEKLIEKDE